MTTLKLLTYNTHLFKDSNADAGVQIRKAFIKHFKDLPDFLKERASKLLADAFHITDLKPMTIVGKDEERFDKIIKNILASEADVVCLQEVWASKWQQKAVDALKQVYPYTPNLDLPQEQPVEKLIEEALQLGIDDIKSVFEDRHLLAHPERIFDDLKTFISNHLKNSSGLVVVSRHEIKDVAFTQYQGVSGDDAMATKGVITFLVSLPGGDVRMATTHCPTNIKQALEAIEKTAAPAAMQDSALDRILLGDFNLHAQKTEDEYEPLNHMMQSYGAEDVVNEFLPDLEECYTVEQADNSLSWLLAQNAENAPHGAKTRIDYVYFAPGTKSPILRPKGAAVYNPNREVSGEWVIPYSFHSHGRDFNTLSLSDHYPVTVEFEIKS